MLGSKLRIPIHHHARFPPPALSAHRKMFPPGDATMPRYAGDRESEDRLTSPYSTRYLIQSLIHLLTPRIFLYPMKASYLPGDDGGVAEPPTFSATVWTAFPVAFAPRSTPLAAALTPRSTPLAAAFAPCSMPFAAALAPRTIAFSTLTTTPDAVPAGDSAVPVVSAPALLITMSVATTNAAL